MRLFLVLTLPRLSHYFKHCKYVLSPVLLSYYQFTFNGALYELIIIDVDICTYIHAIILITVSKKFEGFANNYCFPQGSSGYVEMIKIQIFIFRQSHQKSNCTRSNHRKYCLSKSDVVFLKVRQRRLQTAMPQLFGHFIPVAHLYFLYDLSLPSNRNYSRSDTFSYWLITTHCSHCLTLLFSLRVIILRIDINLL